MDQLKLSHEILYQVVLPISLLVMISAFLRHNVFKIMDNPEQRKKSMTEAQLKDAILQDTAHRSAMLRQNNAFLPLRQFCTKRHLFLKEESGLLNETIQPKSPLDLLAQTQNPSMMIDLVKTQVLSLALGGGLGYLMSSLYPGLIVAKTPFLLPRQFKGMLQKGVDIPNLDAFYMTSLAWYFFVLLSSTNCINLLLHYFDEADDDISGSILTDSMMMPGAQMGDSKGPVDLAGLYNSEKDALKNLAYNYCLDADQLIARLLE